MQGRGRGSYLGLLLDSKPNITMVGIKPSITTIEKAKENKSELTTEDKESGKDNKGNAECEDKMITQPNFVNGVTTDKPPKTTQPIWTSLDLLGNKTRQARINKESSSMPSSSPEQKQAKLQMLDTSVERELKELEDIDPAIVTTSRTPTPPDNVTPKQAHMPCPPKETIHLFSPQEFMTHATQTIQCDNDITDVTSETSTTSSGSSLYIPPHKRTVFKEQTEFSSDNEVYEPRKVERRLRKNMNEMSSSETGELNWQKWKLQRSFKNLIQHIDVHNALELADNIKNVVNDSKLSHNFPGVSEVTVIIEHLLQNIFDKKQNMDIAVYVCQLLNAIYTDELPSSLREVLKEFRQELFAGISNKNIRCDNFCLFLGKLCDIGKVETKSFQDCLKQSVIGCLCEWIALFQNADEDSQEAGIKIQYLCELLELTKNVMPFAKRSWIKSSFAKIKNCILSEKLPRDIKENFVDAILRQSLSTTQQQPQTNDKNSGNKEMNKNQSTQSKDGLDMYKDVKKMLSDLGLENFLEKFKDNLIRDSLLRVEKNDLKSTLQEAGFAPGAILEILLYLEKNDCELTQAISPRSRVKHLGCGLQGFLKTEANPQEGNVRENEAKTFEHSKNDLNSQGGQETSLKESDVDKPKTFELKEAEQELKNLQINLNQQSTVPLGYPLNVRPPPGFLNYTNQSNQTVSKNKEPQNFRSSLNDGNQAVRREVSVDTQKSHVTNRTEKRDMTDTRYNIPKSKGRGRGRRDASGSLATLPKTKTFSDRTKYGSQDERLAGSTFSGSQVGTEDPGISMSRFLRGPTPTRCFICGSEDHRSGNCTNNAAMFD